MSYRATTDAYIAGQRFANYRIMPGVSGSNKGIYTVSPDTTKGELPLEDLISLAMKFNPCQSPEAIKAFNDGVLYRVNSEVRAQQHKTNGE